MLGEHPPATHPLSPLGISVLALLRERDMHPYEMLRRLQERHDRRVVRARPGSLYHVVEWLRARHLIEVAGTGREGNRPERTAYRITAAGDTALRARVRELIADPGEEAPPLLIALVESHNLFRSGVLAALRCRAEGLEARLAELNRLGDTARVDGQAGYGFGLDYLRALTAAELEWARELSARISSGEVVWPRP